MVSKDPKSYRHLEEILKDVNNKCVKMSDSRKEFKDIAYKVIDYVISTLKKNDEAFRLMYSKLAFVGSYFDRLRIKEATEFDLNLIMKLPLNYNLIKIENENVLPGYVTVNIAEARYHPKYIGPVKKVIDKWCDNKGFLLQNRVREWLEGVFTRSLGQGSHEVKFDYAKYNIRLRKSGPAFTLMISSEKVAIDVDLVFALQFDTSIEPPSSIRWNHELIDPWMLIPKPLIGNNCNLFWRISFHFSEKKITAGLQKLKFTNRILKCLRDSQNLNIASYYIKTIFLWEAYKIRNNPSEFWQTNLGYLFVYAVNKLKEYLENGKIPYFWHDGLNLIDSLNKSNLTNMAGRLGNILKKIGTLNDNNEFPKLREFVMNLFGLNGRQDEEQIQVYNPSESPESKCLIL